MSFFNTLQQYVSSGVASLNISPRRFGPSGNNQDSNKASPPPPPPSAVSPLPQHRHPHLQDRSASLKVVSSPHNQRRSSPSRTGSLKDTVPPPSLSITTAAGQQQSFSSGGGTSASSAATIPPPPLLTRQENAPTASGGGVSGRGGSMKKREPIKIMPTFAMKDAGPRRTSWPQFAITGSG